MKSRTSYGDTVSTRLIHMRLCWHLVNVSAYYPTLHIAAQCPNIRLTKTCWEIWTLGHTHSYHQNSKHTEQQYHKHTGLNGHGTSCGHQPCLAVLLRQGMINVTRLQISGAAMDSGWDDLDAMRTLDWAAMLTPCRQDILRLWHIDHTMIPVWFSSGCV